MTNGDKAEAKWTLFYDPHQKEKGKKTKDLVDKLQEELGKDLHLEACEPTPYFGGYSNESTLANVDLVVANKDEARVLCEIEEKGASPKKIIGDIVNIFLANSIMVKGNPRNLGKSYFILGIKVKKGGKSAEKAENLARRIQDKIPELRDRIEIVTDDNIDELIDKTKGKILDKISR